MQEAVIEVAEKGLLQSGPVDHPRTSSFTLTECGNRNTPALMLMRGCKRALVETDLLRGAIDLLLSFVCLFVFINKKIPGAG